MCEALLEKDKAHSRKTAFPKDAPHLFLKLRPTDALLDIPYIKFYPPDRKFRAALSCF